MEEITANNHLSSPVSEKTMDKNQSLSHGDVGKESLKLRISTNHADGTSKIVSHNAPSSHNHNHVSLDKDSIRKDAVSKSKHGPDGDKTKDHKHNRDSSHNDKHRDHKSKSSQNHHDSNSKPKESNHNSSSKDIKNKENSSSSKTKDGLNNSISRPKEHSVKVGDSKSSSAKDGSSKPSEHSAKAKVSNNNLNHSSNSVKENSVNSKPKEHSSSHKPKESSKPKDSSSKPKDSSSSSSSNKPKDSSGSKPKESSSSKPKDSTGSSKPKDSSSSKPKDASSSSKPKDGNSSSSKPKDSSSSSSSKPKDGSSSKPKDGSSSSKPKDSSSTKHKDPSVNSTPAQKVKEISEKSSSSSSSKPKSSGDKSISGSSSKPKDGSSKEKSENKDGKSSGKPENKLNSSLVKVKQEKPDEEKKHHNKDSHGKKDHSNEHKHNDSSSSKHKSKEQTKDANDMKDKLTPKIKQEIKEKSPSEKHHAKDNHKSNDSSKITVNSTLSTSIKQEISTDDELPLAVRREMIKKEQPKREQKTQKRYADASDSEDEPLATRIENAKKLKKEPPKKRRAEDSDDEPASKKLKKNVQNKSAQNRKPQTATSSPTKSPTKKKKEEEQEVWKWWEEKKLDEGVKWKSLEHKGPVFAPEYEPLPKSVKFLYNGEHMHLTPNTEEVATFYSRFLDHEYSSKESFNKNFFKDWRKVMTPEEKARITDLKLCNFKQMNQYFLQKAEERKNMTKEEKLEIKKKNEEIQKEYGFCIIDGHKEKIGNFKIEPPGLFRGRGEHPKMGMHKKRILPKDVTINCSKGSKVPAPPEGHRWKEVRHDNTVTWLACWNENIQGSNKYIMLNPSSKLKGEKDYQKYEIARKLKSCVDTIRDNYRQDWKSKEMRIRQRAVALYFIDKLALRAGNEKEEGETADTVGCCSLRFEHITLDEEKDGQEYVVNFDFLGKDSIRYMNSVPVEKRVFKNLQLFMENKQTGDDLFDRLNTSILNKHLTDLMDGLTAKVFRTFNASKTLQEQLDKLTDPSDSIPAKLLSYNRANRAVAILCNHQRAVPKTFDKSMENLQIKIEAKNNAIKDAKKELKEAKKGRDKTLAQRKEKTLERLKDHLMKLELQATDREENKQIALGTSKLNYLDPRISVAWCKKWEVPIEKVFNRTQRDKFRWAIEMAGPDYVF